MANGSIRKALRMMLVPAAVMPFVAFEQAELLAVAGQAWWLIGYPLTIAALFSLLAPLTGKVHVAAKGAVETGHARPDVLRDRRWAVINNPAFSNLSGNVFHH